MSSRNESDVLYKIQQNRYNAQTTPINFVDVRSIPNVNQARKVTFTTSLAPAGSETKQLQLGRIPSFSKFVSDYARVHGLDYKQSLKDKAIKELYRKNLNGDSLTMVKHTFVTKKPTALLETNGSIGKLVFIDPRLNRDTFVQTKIVDSSQDKYQLARGLQSSMKQYALSTINSQPMLSRNFARNYTVQTFQPLSEKLAIKILEIALTESKKNIFEMSPWMDLGIAATSFEKYKKILAIQKRKIYELPCFEKQEEFTKRLGIEELSKIDELEDDEKAALKNSFDFYFLNISAFPDNREIFQALLRENISDRTKDFEFVFVLNKRLKKLSDFFVWFGFENFRDLIGRGLDTFDQKLFDLVTDPVKYQLARDESILDAARNFSSLSGQTLGDPRDIYEEAKQQQMSSDYRSEQEPLFSSLYVSQNDVEDPVTQEPLFNSLFESQNTVEQREQLDSDPPLASDKKERFEKDTLYFFTKKVQIQDVKPNSYIILAKTVKDNPRFYLFKSFNPETGRITYQAESGDLLLSEKVAENVNLISFPENGEQYDNGISNSDIKTKKYSSLQKQIPPNAYKTLVDRNEKFKRFADINQRLQISKPEFVEDDIAEDYTKKPDSTVDVVPASDPETGEDIPSSTEDAEKPSLEGNGYLGGSLSEDYTRFMELFNPDFSLIGRNGVDYVYRMSFSSA